jgi:hypothetical protein
MRRFGSAAKVLRLESASFAALSRSSPTINARYVLANVQCSQVRPRGAGRRAGVASKNPARSPPMTLKHVRRAKRPRLAV